MSHTSVGPFLVCETLFLRTQVTNLTQVTKVRNLVWGPDFRCEPIGHQSRGFSLQVCPKRSLKSAHKFKTFLVFLRTNLDLTRIFA